MPIQQLQSTDAPADADIQQTSFAQDALSRFICSTLDEAQAAAPEGFDIVVVGSGMYGAYYAAKLFEFTKAAAGRKPRILVLQEGPLVLHEHFQNYPRGLGGLFGVPLAPLLPEGQFRIIAPNGAPETDRVNAGRFSPHHRCVGGKSLFWGGWAPTLKAEDLASWPEAVRSYLNSPDGYDFVVNEIGAEPDETKDDFIFGDLFSFLLTRGRSIMPLQVVDPSIQAQDYEINRVAPPPIAVDARSKLPGFFSPDKYSSLPTLIDAIREDIGSANNSDANRRLFLVPNVKVLRCNTVNGAVRDINVAVRDPVTRGATFQRRQVRLTNSGSVVLAGNSVNSTVLAKNSFPRPEPLTRETMGANLMVHVRGNYVWRVRRSVFEAMAPTLVGKQLGQTALQVEGAITTSSGKKARYHFQFYAAPSNNAGSAEPFLYQMEPDRDDLLQVEREQNDVNWITVGIRTCGEDFGDKNATMEVGGARSSTSSWIDTSPFANDDFGEPLGFAQLVSDQEVDDVRFAQRAAAFRFIAELVGVPVNDAGRQERDVNLNDPNVKIFLLNDQGRIAVTEDGLGTTYHECGTLWMGDDPENSVTDVNARFHHVANAYNIDQALFPTAGSANPVPTGLSLARLAARRMTRKYLPEPAFSDGDAGFTSIFDGTFDNWRIEGASDFQIIRLPGQPDIIEAGIAGGDSRLGLLRFIGDTFSDFVLRLEWKAFSIDANSGIFIRTPLTGAGGLNDAFYANCTEIQIDETGKDFNAGRIPQAVYGGFKQRTGAIYQIASATQGRSKATQPQFSPDGEWNIFEISAQGSQVDVRLNGALVSQGTIPNSLPTTGHIALQCHSEIVQFRNIRIKT